MAENQTSNFASANEGICPPGRRHSQTFNHPICSTHAIAGRYRRLMPVQTPFRSIAVASTFSPRFVQVLAEAKRMRDRLGANLSLIYVGEKEPETDQKFFEALAEVD